MDEKLGFELTQIGIVVRNVKEATEYYTRVFGIGPWQIRDIALGPEQCWVKGKPFNIESHPVAFAQLGPIQIELIEPPEDGIHKWFLDSKGEGLHHLCYHVDDYDAWMEHCKQQGIDVLMNAVFDRPGTGPRRVAYMESDKIGGVLFELSESPPPK